MLSFIYNLVNAFESSHNIPPNLLYLNKIHIQHLMEEFSDEYDLMQIMNLLEMEIIIDSESIHPHVSRTRVIESKTATG